MLTVALLPLLFAMAPALAQTSVLQGTTSTLSAVAAPGYVYKWEIYNVGTVNFALIPGNCPVSSAEFTNGSTGASVKIKWIEPGAYFYKVTAIDAGGCAGNFRIGKIVVSAAENQAVITGVSASGACQTLTLDASGSIGNIVKYEWFSLDQGGLLTPTPDEFKIRFQLASNFTGPLPASFRVRLLVTNSDGETHGDTISISVGPQPVAIINSSGKLEKDGSLMVDGSTSTGSFLNFRWYTTEGQISGDETGSKASLLGQGIYSLEITDKFGCKDTKSFKFPWEIHQINLKNDYARIPWSQDTTINVMDNDKSTLKLIPGTVQIKEQPAQGTVKVNANGSITYVPATRRTGPVHFVYEVCDELNLCASATVNIEIYDSNITLPEGISPNGDGLNDVLEFKGLIENYPKSQINVFSRSGQLVYKNLDYKNDWNGTTPQSSATDIQRLPTSTYYYVLKLGGTNRTVKGFVYIAY